MPSEMKIADLVKAGFLDSATGRGAARGSGDYAAIATVGIDTTGYLYVLDLWVRRASPTRQIAAIFDLHERWHYDIFGIETNCFQQLLLLPLEEERQRRRAAGRAWQVPVREMHHHQQKEMRIATLEPLVTNGWLRFGKGLPDVFWQQLEAFPRGEHDDAIDALEGAVSLVRSMRGESRSGKRRGSVDTLRRF